MDRKYGGRTEVLAAAQTYQLKLAATLGSPLRMLRRDWDQIRLGIGSCSVVGAHQIVVRRAKRAATYWQAPGSLAPYVFPRKMFSLKKLIACKAEQLAVHGQQTGLGSMEPAAQNADSKGKS